MFFNSLLLFIKTLTCTICTYSDFFLVSKLYSSGLKIMPLIWDHLRFMVSGNNGGF